MSSPQSTAPHTLQAPPSDSTLNQRIAEILIATASIYLAAKLIEKLLRPFHITVDAILPVLRIVKRGTTHKPRPKFAVDGLDRSAPAADLVRTMANEDLYYRAAYVVAASRRVQREIDAGEKPLAVILADESLNYRKHEAARNQRAKAARRAALAAQLYGPELGWYLNPLLNNEIECITADGHNFPASQPPRIGLPGAVHMFCGCRPGAPHIGAGQVDDAIDLLMKRGKLKLKKVS